VKGEGKNLEPLEVLIQVNVSGEPTKFGCVPDEAISLAHCVTQLPSLQLHGLMTIAPWSTNPESCRSIFRQLRELRDALIAPLHRSPSTLHLSMGMSQDFEVAIEEGADFVRIGSAIFQ
jgi:pyridoxal phosphate enzyme (YggS family)